MNDQSDEEIQKIELEVEGLVKDLLEMYVETPDGVLRSLEGEFIEPIHLQIVCRRWWNERNSAGGVLIKRKSQSSSNVDIALEEFYEDIIVTAAKVTGTPEKKLREWIGKKLITPSGTRSTVHRPSRSTLTEGIPTEVIDLLDKRHLIRAERRSGVRWYELTHDRLIKPIKESNQRWKYKREKHLRNRIIIPSTIISAIVLSVIFYFYATQPHVVTVPLPPSRIGESFCCISKSIN